MIRLQLKLANKNEDVDTMNQAVNNEVPIQEKIINASSIPHIRVHSDSSGRFRL